MKKIVLPLGILVVGVLLSGVLLNAKPEPVPQPVPPPPPAKVATLRVEPTQGSVPVASQGVVKARRHIDLVAEVGGTIESTTEKYRRGAVVKQGDLLLQIEALSYEVAVARAAAQRAQAAELVAMEKGRSRQAKREWRDLGDETANDLFLRKPQLANAEAQLAAAKADLKQAERNLEKTRIVAPFDGRVGSLQADLGQYVGPGAKLASVYTTAQLEVSVPVTAEELTRIERAPGATVSLWNAQGQRWRGAVVVVDGQLDEKTRTGRVLVELQGDSDLPRVGEFVQVEIAGREQSNIARVPAGALRSDQTVWSLEGDTAAVKPVRVLSQSSDQVLLQFSDSAPLELIVSAPQNLKPGSPAVSVQ